VFRNQRLLAFFVLTFVWSWACWFLAIMLKSNSGYAEKTLFFLGGFGPSISAVCIVGYTGGKTGLLAWLSSCIRWHRSWGFGLWVLAFFAPLMVLALAAVRHVALGGTIPPSPAIEHVPLFLANFILVLIAGGPLGEELGWRGFALPEMQKHMSWRSASLALGGIWGIWHLPLLFVAGAPQSGIQFFAFFVLIISTSVFYTWLYNRSRGSVLPVLALHTASNSWPGLIPILPSDADQRPYYFVITLVVIAAIWLLFQSDLASPRNRK
jgi:uncharacterized protein